MYLFLALFIFILLFYYVFNLIRLIGALNRPKLLPANEADVKLIRMHPQKGKYDMAEPTLRGQRFGLMMYGVILLVIAGFFYTALFTDFGDWYILIVAIVPMFQMGNIVSAFAVLEDGVIVGSKFLSWSEIKGYEYVPIDVNNKFYGYDSEFNDSGYVVRFHQTILSKNGVIANDEMKARLDKILLEKLGQPAEAKK